jgi:hypothetical protein
MSSRNMCLLPRATLHSDSEQVEYPTVLALCMQGKGNANDGNSGMGNVR